MSPHCGLVTAFCQADWVSLSARPWNPSGSSADPRTQQAEVLQGGDVEWGGELSRLLGVRADLYVYGPVAMQFRSFNPFYSDKQHRGLSRVHSHSKATHSHVD